MAPVCSSNGHKSSFTNMLRFMPSSSPLNQISNGSESSSNAPVTNFQMFRFPRSLNQTGSKSSRALSKKKDAYITHSSINLLPKLESAWSLNKSNTNFHEQFIQKRISANESCQSISSQISQSIKISNKRSPSKAGHNSNQNYCKHDQVATPSGQQTTRTNTAATPCPYYEVSNKMKTEKQKPRKKSTGFLSNHLQSLFNFEMQPEEQKKEEEEIGYETECNPN